MKMISTFPPLYYQIVEVIKPSAAFLVGGAVRDLLLGNPIHDLDFALPEDTIILAKKVADSLNGDYYLLDKERQAGRVILRDEHGKRLVVDLTTFQGNTIEEDLLTRDFTITSMAIDIYNNQQIIDPFQGVRDLKEKQLRCTSDQSLRVDPLRGMRAVRMAAQFGLLILPDTKKQIRDFGLDLAQVSPERIRDEFFRILEGPNQAAALASLQILGIYQAVLLHELTKGQQNSLRKLEALWSLLKEEFNSDAASNWAYGVFVHRLGRYRRDFQSYLQEEFVPGRTVYELSYLSLLIQQHREGDQDSDISSMQLSTIVERFHLSNQEKNRVEKTINAVQAYQKFSDLDIKNNPIEVYRFFKEPREAGLEGIILALATFAAEEEQSSLQTSWPEQIDKARTLLEGWWEKKELWIDPLPLLNGDDLQADLNLDPGPEIGKFLELLREAQVQGGIQTREDSLEYIKQLMTKRGSS
jgi:poly(A) polymerase